ncbi:hypothetical protein L7A47_36610, partial [Achromobacter xylosoxidans]|uniref:hypothetical protein n=1 Tax=Alcaligenes xylosoxydans xylosoxydans TaxID=85698 RepID=UPI001F10950A
RIRNRGRINHYQAEGRHQNDHPQERNIKLPTIARNRPVKHFGKTNHENIRNGLNKIFRRPANGQEAV